MRVSSLQNIQPMYNQSFGKFQSHINHHLSPRAKSKIGIIAASGIISAATAYLAENIHAFLPTMAITLPIINWIDKKLENHNNDNKTNITA